MKSRAIVVAKSSALVLTLLMLVGVMTPSSAGPRVRNKTIAPGVERTWIRFAKGPIVVRVLTIDLSRAHLRVGLARERLPGFERTSDMASRLGAVAAVNGDYARSTGRPVHTIARTGELAQTELSWGRSFAVGAGGSNVYIGRAQTDLYARRPDAELFETINRVNAGWPNNRQINQYTPAGGAEEPPPEDACSARLFPQASARMRADGDGVERPMVVDRTVCRKKRLTKLGGTVVSTPMFGPRRTVVESLVPGEEVVLGWGLRDPGAEGSPWEGVSETLGGNPTLVENSRIVDNNVDGAGVFFDRHPRTGVGYDSRRHRLFLVVVDGRQKGYSVGMRLRRFARFFNSYLGADFALNLDGGGSSTMFIGGQGVINRPSDGRERAVSSSLLVVRNGGPGPQPAPSPTPEPSPTGLSISRAGAWRLAVQDPASTGGLASYLRQRGYRLPAFMEDALGSFNRR